MTFPCIRCGQTIDEGGLVKGRCHGCRAEYAEARQLARLVTFSARGRNGKAKHVTLTELKFQRAVINVALTHPLQQEISREGHNRLFDKLHLTNLPVRPETAEFARRTVDSALGSFEDTPLDNL